MQSWDAPSVRKADVACVPRIGGQIHVLAILATTDILPHTISGTYSKERHDNISVYHNRNLQSSAKQIRIIIAAIPLLHTSSQGRFIVMLSHLTNDKLMGILRG